MDASVALSGERDPWFARNSGKMVLIMAGLMLLSLLGIIPSAITKGQEHLLEGQSKLYGQHDELVKRIIIQCVHAAKDASERDECVTGELRPR